MKILIKACTNGNFGDDLFIKIILERYKKYNNINFYILVYDSTMYSYYSEEYPNVTLIPYPVPNLFVRGAVKIFEKIFHLEGILKKTAYKIVYRKLFQNRYNLFINIGGSQFAEHVGEKFVISNWLEKLFAQKVKADKKLLLNINFGPYSTSEFVDECKSIFECYDDVCFRDYFSYNLFKVLKNVRYAPDIALTIDTNNLNTCSSGIIGINVIDLGENIRTLGERKNFLINYEHLIDSVVIKLLERNYKVRFLGFCNSKTEIEYIKKLMYKYNERIGKLTNISYVQYDVKNISEFIKSISECDGILATRFHAMILAFRLRKIVYPICYDNKLINFLNSIDYQGPFSILSDLGNAEDIVEYITSNSGVVLSEKTISESYKQFLLLDQYIYDIFTEGGLL